jgi:membrane-bound serine protease (ClpP class)
MSSAEVIGGALILAAVLMLILEVKAPGFGAFGVAGSLALIAGLYVMLGMSAAALPALLALGIPVIAIFTFLAVLAHRARSNKVTTGEAGMIGLEGRAETALEPGGKVFVRGELWDAWSPLPLERGMPVRVVGVRGLELEVTAAGRDRRPALSAVFRDGDTRDPRSGSYSGDSSDDRA